LDHIPLEGEQPVFIGFTHFAQFLKVVFLKFFNLYSLKGKVVKGRDLGSALGLEGIF
jgi:hypothetical protein